MPTWLLFLVGVATTLLIVALLYSRHKKQGRRTSANTNSGTRTGFSWGRVLGVLGILILVGLPAISVYNGLTNGKSKPSGPASPRVTRDISELTAGEQARYRFVEAGFPKMMIVSDCVSRLRQQQERHVPLVKTNPDGSKSVGITQINTSKYEKLIKDTGYDPYTLDGNLKLAIHLLRNPEDPSDPYAPWQSSKDCWQPRYQGAATIEIVAPADGSYGPKVDLGQRLLRHGFSRDDVLWGYSTELHDASEQLVLSVNDHKVEVFDGTNVNFSLRDVLAARTKSGKEVRVYYVFYQRP